MVLATVPKRENKSGRITRMPATAQVDWVNIASSGSLITGGLLLLSGRKRAGMVMAASGTALAMLDNEDTLRRWWDALPEHVDRAQRMVEQVQELVDEVTEKGESLRRVLTRDAKSVRA